MSAPGPGHDRGLAAGVGGDGDRDDAALLPRPAGASREPRGRSDAVHAGDRGRLPGRRGPAADGRGGRPERSSPATRPVRPPRGPAWPRSASSCSPTANVASKTVTAALRPRRPRLEGVQRRAQAARRRPRRRPGQADRQDLPARPPRLGHGRGDPRRDEHARVRLDRGRAAGPAGRGRGRRAGRGPRGLRARRPGGRRSGCVRVLVAEPVAAEGVELLRGASRGRRTPRSLARRAVRDPARLRRADRPQPGPGRRRR